MACLYIFRRKYEKSICVEKNPKFQVFLELSYKQESIEIAKITSSIQLTAEQQKEIAEKLKTITGAKQIKLALKVDPQLIGGFTIEIGSKMIDTSIRGQLKQISYLLGT